MKDRKSGEKSRGGEKRGTSFVLGEKEKNRQRARG